MEARSDWAKPRRYHKRRQVDRRNRIIAAVRHHHDVVRQLIVHGHAGRCVADGHRRTRNVGVGTARLIMLTVLSPEFGLLPLPATDR